MALIIKLSGMGDAVRSEVSWKTELANGKYRKTNVRCVRMTMRDPVGFCIALGLERERMVDVRCVI